MFQNPVPASVTDFSQPTAVAGRSVLRAWRMAAPDRKVLHEDCIRDVHRVSSGNFASVRALSRQWEMGTTVDSNSPPGDRHGHETMRPPVHASVSFHPAGRNTPISSHSFRWNRKKQQTSEEAASPDVSPVQPPPVQPASSLQAEPDHCIVSFFALRL